MITLLSLSPLHIAREGEHYIGKLFVSGVERLILALP